MAKETCGHINKHSYGTDGKLDNLACDLPAGHTGNHSGQHLERAKHQIAGMTEEVFVDVEKEVIANGRRQIIVEGQRLWQGLVRAEWNDQAGTLASEIVPVNLGTEVISGEMEEIRLKR